MPGSVKRTIGIVKKAPPVAAASGQPMMPAGVAPAPIPQFAGSATSYAANYTTSPPDISGGEMAIPQRRISNARKIPVAGGFSATEFTKAANSADSTAKGPTAKSPGTDFKSFFSKKK